MHKFGLVLAFGAVADVRPAGLIGFKIRARRNFAVQLLSRQPDFNVIGLRRGWSHIAGAQRHGPIRKAQFLENLLGVMRQFFVFFVGVLRPRELYQFNFLKLMLPDDPAHIFAVRSRLAAETWGVGGKRDWQPRRLKNFIAIKICDRNLRRGNQPEILVAMGHAKQIRSKFRQLPGAIHRI